MDEYVLNNTAFPKILCWGEGGDHISNFYSYIDVLKHYVMAKKSLHFYIKGFIFYIILFCYNLFC
jgi:hypothetical protein